jgi:predicted dehydrogenase
MKVIRTAIIGQGRSGRDIHGRYILTDPDHFKVVAVAELLPERRARAASEYKCDVYRDYRELFKRKDLDLIINSSFSHLHAPITLDILKAGFNVLCEKPLASNVKDVDRLIAAAKKSKKVFAIFQQARFAPYFTKVREIIDSGVLGRIVQISITFDNYGRRWDWQTLQSYKGGSLMNTGPHPLDQALVLFGKGMPEVRCFMDRANTFGDAEDHVKLILSGKGHPLIDLEISSCCAYPRETYHVYGTRGGMKTTSGGAEWKYFRVDEAPKQKLTKAPLRKPDGTPAYCGEKLSWHEEKWPPMVAPDAASKAAYSPATAASNDMGVIFYDMLYNAIVNGAPLKVKPEEIRRQAAVIDECRRQNPHIYRKK